jgi:hypothetical protein
MRRKTTTSTMTATALVTVALVLATSVHLSSATSAVFGSRPGHNAGWFHAARFPSTSSSSTPSTRTTTLTTTLLETLRGGASKKKRVEKSPEEIAAAAAAEAVDLYLPGLLEATVIRTNKVCLVECSRSPDDDDHSETSLIYLLLSTANSFYYIAHNSQIRL